MYEWFCTGRYAAADHHSAQLGALWLARGGADLAASDAGAAGRGDRSRTMADPVSPVLAADAVLEDAARSARLSARVGAVERDIRQFLVGAVRATPVPVLL